MNRIQLTAEFNELRSGEQFVTVRVNGVDLLLVNTTDLDEQGDRRVFAGTWTPEAGDYVGLESAHLDIHEGDLTSHTRDLGATI